MSENPKKPTRIRLLRTGTQVFFVALFAFFAVHHQFTKGGPTGSPPLDVYCPFGGIEGLVRYAAMGELIPRISASNFVLLAGVIVMTLLVKAAFCSWVCPLGSAQEWLGRLGRRWMRRNLSPPERVDRTLRYVKYLVLVAVSVGSAWAGYLVFRDYDPFIALFHLGWGHLAWTAYLVLVLTLVAAVFVMRPWCKYLCPFGAVLAPLGKLALIKPTRDATLCKGCKVCDRVCPMGVAVSEQKRVTSAECHACLDCLADAPHPGALRLRAATGQAVPYGVVWGIVLVSIFGFVYAGKATGIYSTTKESRCGGCRFRDLCAGEDSPAARPAPGRSQTPSEDEHGDNTVLVNGRQVVIRGSMSLSDIEKETGVPATYLTEKLKMPADVPRDVNMGRLKREYGFEMGSVRELIRQYPKIRPGQ